MDVIICSSNPVVVEAVSKVLPPEHGRAMLCESGLEMLGLIGVLDSDLLVLDMETPGLGDLLLISAIRELAPRLPILAVSTKDGADVHSLAQRGIPYVRIEGGVSSDSAALRTELAGLAADLKHMPEPVQSSRSEMKGSKYPHGRETRQR